MSLLVMGTNHKLEEKQIKLLHKKGRWRVDSCFYVDNIIFGLTKDELAHSFSKLMQAEFKMSMIGELNHFLGLQIR